MEQVFATKLLVKNKRKDILSSQFKKERNLIFLLLVKKNTERNPKIFVKKRTERDVLLLVYKIERDVKLFLKKERKQMLTLKKSQKEMFYSFQFKK